jgi:hypothetical protein
LRGFNAYECGLLGSISASVCIRQYGPPVIDNAAMAAAKAALPGSKRRTAMLKSEEMRNQPRLNNP